MKFTPGVVVYATLLLLGATCSSADQTNPLSKVITLLRSLSAKVVADGEAEQKAYKAYFEWCDETARTLTNNIKTTTTSKEKLEAKINELTSDIQVSESKIDDLAAAIGTSEAELKNATLQRESENADFVAGEAELEETIDAISRALAILDREMAKNPAALAQVDSKNWDSVLRPLDALVDAAGFSGRDRDTLVAFVQQRQQSDSDDEDDDLDLNAPAAASYTTHSSSIVEVLEDMKEKADETLASLRESEKNSKHNFDLLKQSLEDQSAADSKDLDSEKTGKASSEEAKASAEGHLEVTLKELKNTQTQLAITQADCMQVASDHEAVMKARDQELGVIDQAVKVLQASSAGAVAQTYSFVQLKASSTTGTTVDLSHTKVVSLVKKLAKEHHSATLAQLASRIAAVVRYGGASGSKDPFSKVRGLIEDLIAKLVSEASAEAQEKAFCDEELAKTNTKKSDLDDTVEALTTKIDQATAASAQLKKDVKELQDDLVALSKSQAEMDKMRQEEHANYVTAKANLEQGLEGVRSAIQILKDYYAADTDDNTALFQQASDVKSLMQQPARPQSFQKSSGAGGSIIGILQVLESDFANNLSAKETEEADGQSAYEKTTQENNISKAEKDQDVKHKTQEFTALDKALSDLSSDRDTANDELSAVNQYLAELEDRCIAKPETYAERTKRRAAEIAGLKEALTVLEGEVAFLQKSRRRNTILGATNLEPDSS